MKQRLLSPLGLMISTLLVCMLSVNAHATSSKQLAVVFNSADPESREIARVLPATTAYTKSEHGCD